MKKYGKRYLAGSVTALLVLLAPHTILAAAATEGTAAETIEISWLGMLEGDPVTDESYTIRLVEDVFNVDIVPVNVVAQETEKMELIFASGEIPDYANPWAPDYWKLFDDGVFRSIPISLISEHAPLYSRMLDELDGGAGWKYHLVPGMSDEKWRMTRVNITEVGGWWAPHFRYDWLEKLGKAPSDAFDMYADPAVTMTKEEHKGKYYLSRQSYTLDEFERILIDFRDKDLDGNGRDDTIPLGLTGQNHLWLGQFNLTGMYGIVKGRNVMEDGELKMPVITNAYERHLKNLQRWYAMGLIDKEFPTLKLWPMVAKVNEGHIGAFPMHAAYMTPQQYDTFAPVFDLGGTLLTMAPMKGPDGHYGGPGNFGKFQGGAVIGHQVNDAKLAKILEIYDWANYDKVGHVQMRFGEENQHYTWDGAPYASSITRNEGLAHYGGELGLQFFPESGSINEDYKVYAANPVLQYVEGFFKYGPGDTEFGIRAYRHDIFGDSNLGDLRSKYGSALDTIESEFTMKAITGAINIDAEWDDFVSMWRRSGGDAFLAEYAKQPILAEFLRTGEVVR